MAYDLKSGSDQRAIRKEVVDAMIKQIAPRAYKFKQACAIVTSDAWTNTFFREQTTVPAGQSGNSQKGIPRGANFPQYSIGWTEVSVRVVKHGLEDNIFFETIKAGLLDVQARTVIRLTEGVTKSVDDDIWDSLTENRTVVNIQTMAVTAGRWDEASAAIINDVFKASQLIEEANYGVDDLICFINPYQKRFIMKYLSDKGAQFPQIAGDVTRTGQIGKIGNVTFVSSISVTASCALVVKPQTCATFKQLVPLQSEVITDPFKSVTIRVVEEGVVELTDPKAVVLITNTQALA